MEEIKQMKEKNIAVELLKRLLQGRVRGFQRTNIVKSEQFSDLLFRHTLSVPQGLILTRRLYKKLLKLAQAIMLTLRDEGEKLGLSKKKKHFMML